MEHLNLIPYLSGMQKTVNELIDDLVEECRKSISLVEECNHNEQYRNYTVVSSIVHLGMRVLELGQKNIMSESRQAELRQIIAELKEKIKPLKMPIRTGYLDDMEIKIPLPPLFE